MEVAPVGESAKVDAASIIRDQAILYGQNLGAKDALVGKIEKRPGDYAPPVLFATACHLFSKDDREGAYFWFCLARLRAMYDVARCADKTVEDAVGVMIMNVDGAFPELRQYAWMLGSDKIVPFTEKVLKFDRETPYDYDQRYINLHGMEAFTGSEGLSLPKKEWPALLKKVRADILDAARSTATQLKEKEKKPNQSPQPTR